jgi:hypothetical protein
MAGRKTEKGRFIPHNPQKYVGDPNNIWYRSSWEKRMLLWLDRNNAVLKYSSEELAIPYINPVAVDAFGRQKISHYYPDFIVMYQDKTGAVKKEIIEVKPLRETMLTPGMSNRDKQIYAVNRAKWAAADDFAKRNNATFRIVTEASLFHQGGRRK